MFSDAKSKTSKIKGRKPLWLAIVVVIVWMSISSFTGPLFGKLSTVQENNNSTFLPEDSVEVLLMAFSMVTFPLDAIVKSPPVTLTLLPLMLMFSV